MSVRMKLSLRVANVICSIYLFEIILLSLGPYCIEKFNEIVILGILVITFRDIEIQCFLIFGDIGHISFRDMGYLSKI